MKIFKLSAGLLLVAVIIFSCRRKDDSISKVLNTADNNFILLAGINHYLEAETAKVAVSRASDSVVLSFANYLLAEHTKALSDLKIMSTIVGFTVKDSIDPARDTIITRLKTLTGRSFDSTFIHMQLAYHDSTINIYTAEVSNGLQVNVKSYANTYLQNFVTDKQTADSIAVHF